MSNTIFKSKGKDKEHGNQKGKFVMDWESAAASSTPTEQDAASRHASVRGMKDGSPTGWNTTRAPTPRVISITRATRFSHPSRQHDLLRSQ